MGRPAEGYEGNYWGCWILLGAPVFIISLLIIWAFFVPIIISTKCAMAGPGEVVEYFDKEYTCRED